MQLKSSTHEKLLLLKVSKFDSANILLKCSSRFAMKFATRNFNIKAYLPCSTTNLLTVNGDRTRVAVNIFDVSWTIV